jgi:hypothetical protein
MVGAVKRLDMDLARQVSAATSGAVGLPEFMAFFERLSAEANDAEQREVA